MSFCRRDNHTRVTASAGKFSRWTLTISAVFWMTLGASGVSAALQIEFNRDIRPILADRCFRCHGPDSQSRMADLRLDVRESAVATPADSSARARTAAVVPGHSEKSELIRRIRSQDPDVMMPPPETNQTLSTAEIELLRRWIDSGAEYQPHWSLTAPTAVPLPEIADPEWAGNEVDYFIAAKLDAAGLKPSAEAPPHILLRRAALDLTGLPPDPGELQRFLDDDRPDAFEQAVDRLLASPHFGEQMAVPWLDAARYADTNGYFGDKTRSIWPWRDWVIEAFNRNMPFDQFTIAQLAGDLLPGASTSDLVATGFNRNHIANNETGIIDEEYRVEYVADRLETTATTWMGLTVGCARCHDHKYDPISQKEYYQLFAFFNNGPEKGLVTEDSPSPKIELPGAELKQQLARLQKQRSEAEQTWSSMLTTLQPRCDTWKQSAATRLPASPADRLVTHVDFDEQIQGDVVGTSIDYPSGILGTAAAFDATRHVEQKLVFDPDAAWTIAVWSKSTSSLGCLLSVIEPTDRRRGIEVIWQKGRFQINLVHHWGADALMVSTRTPVSASRWHHLVLSYDGSRMADGLKVYVDGQSAECQIHLNSLSGTLKNAEPLRIGRRDAGLGFYGQLDEVRILQSSVLSETVQDWTQSERLRGILAISEESRSASEEDYVLDAFLQQEGHAAARAAREQLKQIQEAEQALKQSVPVTLVMQELPQPRPTYVLIRGEYNRPDEAVRPQVPNSLSAWPEGAPDNRLGLARWLVSGNHPLTARVAVNRFWQQCFGEGLVRTMNDFGAQGENPSHPELLDWLALRFVDSGWDVKALMKLIVTSAAYRQSSVATAEQRTLDPDNRLLSRMSRFRLSAEVIRDQSLFVSGLLVTRIGGPGTHPYQPAGLWEDVSYNGDESYQQDVDEGLWRRSLYTFIKRQSPPPALTTFDGPTREKCTTQRARTNTPLQALLLLNDVTYIEAARCLAASTIADRLSDSDRLRTMFRRATSRWPETSELQVLEALLQQQSARFASAADDARQLVRIGESRRGLDLNPVELAAWTVVAHSILNLDETITRP